MISRASLIFFPAYEEGGGGREGGARPKTLNPDPPSSLYAKGVTE